MNMKILLTGGSGFIGSHIVAALHNAGHDVMCISRRHGVDFNRMLKPEDWLPFLPGVDAVINSVGIIAETSEQRYSVLHTYAPVALFRACEMTGVSRVIQVSALGADENAVTPYQITKKAADDVLRESALLWFILRPSLVYGEGGASTKFFKRLASLPVIPIVGQGTQLIQPVHIDDLVDAVRACLQSDSTHRTIDVVGEHAISLTKWLQSLRRHIGKRDAKLARIPFRVLLALSHFGRYLVPLFTADNLHMLQRGNTADAKPLIELLGRMPCDLP